MTVIGLLRRLAEPLVLGTLANVLVNALFNPGAMQWSIDEFVVAWLLSFPITELNRYIDRRLEASIPWSSSPGRRFLGHFLVLAISLVVLLNVLGNAYLWLSGEGFFSMDEYLIVNLVTLTLAFLLATVRWAVQFYKRWLSAESRAEEAGRQADELRQGIARLAEDLALQRGTSTVNVPIRTVRLARIDSGVVRVYTEDDQWFVYAGTLGSLMSRLPAHGFFQVSRDVILHREAIRGMASGSFGKVELTIEPGAPDPVVVSRPKAAAFRRWYHSNSVQKS